MENNKVTVRNYNIKILYKSGNHHVIRVLKFGHEVYHKSVQVSWLESAEVTHTQIVSVGPDNIEAVFCVGEGVEQVSREFAEENDLDIVEQSV
jgi:hypothetical protein